MRRLHMPTFIASGGILGIVAGLLAAGLMPVPRGATHSCPYGASVEACTYPGSRLSWELQWSCYGLVLGLLVGVGVGAWMTRSN